MPRDLERYANNIEVLVNTIRNSFDPTSDLKFKKVSGPPVLATRLSGTLRRDHVVLHVKENFNYNPDTGVIDKDYRYTFLYHGDERLRIETQKGKPEHAHFPPLFRAKSGRHFDIYNWPDDLKDMDFEKAFALWGEMVRSSGKVPAAFKVKL